jgi:L-ascorbate metabolism protein UlaG (beta-lactamase superfamily)
VTGGGRITWLGHATALLELGGARILTDPVLRGRIAHIRRRVPAPDPGHSERLDAVLVSHAHRDHLDLPSLRSLACDGPIVVPHGSGRLLRRLDAEVVELEAGDRVRVGGAEVIGTEAVHDGRRNPFGRSRPALGFVVAAESRVYFAGDTDLFPGMEVLGRGLDAALIPVWGWGPRVDEGHLDPRRAAEAASLLRPRMAVPIHFGTLASPGAWLAEPDRPAREFARHVAELAPGVDVRVLAPGAALELDPGAVA